MRRSGGEWVSCCSSTKNGPLAGHQWDCCWGWALEGQSSGASKGRAEPREGGGRASPGFLPAEKAGGLCCALPAPEKKGQLFMLEGPQGARQMTEALGRLDRGGVCCVNSYGDILEEKLPQGQHRRARQGGQGTRGPESL